MLRNSLPHRINVFFARSARETRRGRQCCIIFHKPT